jgi:alkylated DNA repair dioxygenase AlkB
MTKKTNKAARREGLPGCKYVEDLLTPAEADALFEELSDLPWEQHIIPMYGKKIPAPRLFQWMGIPPQPKSYTGGTPIEGGLYGQKITPIDWTPAALTIKAKVEEVTGEKFDSLNLNMYRDDRDHIGWHIDKEDEGLWTAPIASVSLGAVRTFQIREFKIAEGHQRKKEKIGDTYSLPLAHGSLVVMPAGFQSKWLHRLAQTSEPCGPRINLTFRHMMETPEAQAA